MKIQHEKRLWKVYQKNIGTYSPIELMAYVCANLYANYCTPGYAILWIGGGWSAHMMDAKPMGGVKVELYQSDSDGHVRNCYKAHWWISRWWKYEN